MFAFLDIKNLIAVLLFLGLGTYTLLTSYLADKKEDLSFEKAPIGTDDQSEHYFKNILFYVMRDGKKQLMLNSTELSYMTKIGKIIFFDPIGQAFNAEGIPTDYSSKRGLYLSEQGRIHLEVDAYFRKVDSQVWADKADYYMQKDYVSGQGNVRTLNIDSATKDVIEVHSHQFIGRPKQGLLDYRGDVKGKIQRSRVYEPGITFEAQHLIGYRDQSRMELRENVKVVRLGVIATSRNGEIFMENYNKKLKYFVLSDDVKVWEKVVNLDGTSFVREAFGDKLEGLTSEGKLILTGLPKVIQQGDTIRGNRIIIKENNQVVEVDDSNTNFIIR